MRQFIATLVFMAGLPPVGSDPSLEGNRTPSRLVHRFDFDERPQGNMESLPRFWVPVLLPGFPRFAQGGFDDTVGHPAPPSFFLASRGRNVAYRYNGSETPVRTGCVYQVKGFLRPDRLEHARACISAHYVDADGVFLDDSLVRTPYFGPVPDRSRWERFDLSLPAAPPRAASIGLVAWLLQEAIWNPSGSTPRSITRVDVHAGLWIDEVSVLAVPRIQLTTSRPGNVLAPDGPQFVQVTIIDGLQTDRTASLRLTDAEGRVVADHVIPTDLGNESVRIPVDSLSPGFYTATLRVSSPDAHEWQQSTDFLRLGVLGDARPPAEGFGIVLDDSTRTASPAVATLLHQLRVGNVKIPLSPDTDRELTPHERQAAFRDVQELLRLGLVLHGILNLQPIRPTGGTSEEAMNSARSTLATLAAPYASVFRTWQLGPDPLDAVAEGSFLQESIKRVRTDMESIIPNPKLGICLSGSSGPPFETPSVDEILMALDTPVSVRVILETLQRFRDATGLTPSVHVRPFNGNEYRRVPRLVDFARRLILARYSGSQVVYSAQLWRVTDSAGETVVEPLEEFLLLRTIASVLHHAEPRSILDLGPGITGLVFSSGTEATVALWDDAAPASGRDHVFLLGRARRQIDMWGNALQLDSVPDGRHRIRLSTAPIFVEGVEPWLPGLWSSFTIDPKHVESGLDVVEHRLRLSQVTDQPLSGELELVGPEDWDIRPRSMRFAMSTGQTTDLPVVIAYPPAESAGTKRLTVQVRLDQPPYTFEVPLAIEVGLSDLEVHGAADVVGADLLLRQIVTNRSGRALHLRCSAQVPGRERQYRPLTNLGPGETQTVEYRINGGAELTGSIVRLSLGPVGDSRRSHHLDLRVR